MTDHNCKYNLCPVCNGSQTVLENLYTHVNSSTGINFIKCKSCNGLGYINNCQYKDAIETLLNDIPNGDARIIQVKPAGEASSKNQMREMEYDHLKLIVKQEFRRKLKGE